MDDAVTPRTQIKVKVPDQFHKVDYTAREGDGEDVGEDSDEDEDIEAEQHEDEEHDVGNPSDVKGELEGILSGNLEFAGAFSFNKTYPTAPNPALSVDGLRTISLPLNQTIVDKSVCDSWEIDASKVHVEDNAWESIMGKAIHDVCEVLGVNFDASKPRAELHKLLLYETGSHFLPHVDIEKVDGMFASIVIVLQSRFIGGVVHVKHGDLHLTYDPSSGSLTNTSVLAWYTDVEHEVKAITSGYRLALSFNLIHTADTLRPALNASSIPSVKACDAERSIPTVGEKHLCLAVFTFGISEMKPCLELVLERDPSNDWVVGQRAKRFGALKKVGRDEHKALTEVALKYGGVDFFETNVLPLIMPTTDSATLLEYATSLRCNEAIPAEARTRMEKSLLAAAVAKFDFYAAAPVINSAYSSYSYSKPPEESGQVERANAYIKASLELGCDDVLPATVDKLLSLSGQPGNIITRRVKGVLIPLEAYAREVCSTTLGRSSPPALEKLSTTTNSLYVRAALANPRSLTIPDVPTLIQALITGYGFKKPVIDALELCLSLKLPEACKFVIGRLMNPSKLDVTYIKEQLAPIVPDMRALLVKYKQPPTSEAFAAAFQRIMVMSPRPPDVAMSLLANLQARGRAPAPHA
ncbi:hypothetical protein BC628DRAFT_1417257 [Trametes gibbosa]|nr:hypothetical protein BC628DRAFT_1417257 [Trametes gibbosa]